MQRNVKKLPKGEVELTITVEVEEMRPQLEAAARELSEQKPIAGYRPGKASYDVVKQHFGEMAIYEAAANDVIRKAYVAAVREENLNVFGEPHVHVQKLAPGNALEFMAHVDLVPEVTDLPNLDKIKIKSQKPVIKDEEVEAAVTELQKMQTKEVLVEREVRSGDKVMVDMDMSLDNVPLDGGQARNHGIYLKEEYYVPGLKDQIIGMKAGDEKKFDLAFPESHYQKNIAGKNVTFVVKVKSVFELTAPELDEEFAKGLGQKSVDDLRAKLRENMELEATEKESRRAENEAVEKIVEKSRFDDIPEAIVNQEVERMVYEMAHELTDRGVELEDYLSKMGKKITDLKLEFAPQAVKRVKAALVMREIGLREKLDPTDPEIVEEQQKLMNAYSDDAETQAKIRDDEFLDYIKSMLRNRKVGAMIREKMIVIE